jgi:hypothetical protein
LVLSRVRKELEQKLLKEHPDLLEQVLNGAVSPYQALDQLDFLFREILKKNPCS